MDQAWDDQVCAVLLEPVLGEGGVLPAPEGYLAELRKLCQDRGALLIFDEIQTGLGRTGRLFGYEHSGVTPDVMTLAKALANGLPAGAVCASQEVASLFSAGTHATTFGAGPVIMAAATAVMENLTAPGFMDSVWERGVYFKEQLEKLAQHHSEKVVEVRGLGMMLGLALKGQGRPLVDLLLQKGFIINCTQDTVLRFVPPLVVSQEQIDALIQALDSVLTDWSGE
jgi:acetylornithine/succinyldiaminopimelate/putrescine aminotransferase